MAVALLCALTYTTTASANVTHSSYGEPTYTKGTSNTWFFDWNNPGSNDYYICLQFYKDGVEQNANNTDCYHKYNQLSGTQSETRTGLLSGHNYTIEAHSYYDTCGCGIYGHADADASQTTTMDTSVPTAVAGVDGTAVYTNNPVLGLHVDYHDTISGPWPSTFECIQKGSPCSTLNYDANCSVPNAGRALTNSFDCHADVSSVANHDGKWYFCAAESDYAIPDNPTNPNQFTATSDKANISASNCGYVTLDTTPPVESPTADRTTVTVGDLVNFTAQSTDSSSGVDASKYTWSFGDNTSGAAGPSVSHTYTAPGTYQVTLNGKDVVGNAGTGHLTVTVNPPPSNSGGGDTSSGGGDTNTTSGTTTNGTTTNGTGTNGGTTTNSGGGGTITPTTISQLSGGGSTQQSSVSGGLGVIAPKRFRAGLRSLVLALTPSQPGKVKVALVRRGRIFAKKSHTYAAAGTYSLTLRMKRKIKPGRYALKITFIPQGSAGGKTKTLHLKIVRKKRRHHHKKVVYPRGRTLLLGGPVLRSPTL